MINGTLANIIKNDIFYSNFIIFIFIIGLIGIILQFFEPYPMFWLLFPILLIMFVSVILILRFCLNELQKFQDECIEPEIKENCVELFGEKNKSFYLYTVPVIAYFVCLYRLQFVEISLMGLFIFLLGGGTFFLALISYRICVGLTKSLIKTEKNIACLAYDKKFPANTLWLQYFFRLHRVLMNAALIISIFFVLENSILFIANYKEHVAPLFPKEAKKFEFFKHFFVEWLLIWVVIFVAIVVALPLIKQIQKRSLKNIILHIQATFSKEITDQYSWESLYYMPRSYYSVLNIIQHVQNSLETTYFPCKTDGVISFGVSLLNFCTHLLSICIPFLMKE